MSLKCLLFSSLLVLVAAQQELPPYIKQCRASDPELLDCLKGSLHHLKPYLKAGIPEIEMPSVEPFVIDLLTLQLTGGTNGYRINLRDLETFGASNFTVKRIKLEEGTKPFEAVITMPRLVIKAKYTSSGVLIIIPASGGGDFGAVFDGVTCLVSGHISTRQKPNGNFLHIDSLAIELNIKKVKLTVAKIFNNNRILTEATNLFLKENGQEILKAMQPQLQKKLSSEFKKIGNQLLKHVPRENFLID
ncbi:unnamed protein product [Diamesa tonsa]